jgi:hypothetical protein
MKKISEAEAIELAKSNYIKIIVEDCKQQKKFDKFLESMLSCSKNNYKVDVIEASEIMEAVDMAKMEKTVHQDSSPIEIITAYTNEIELSVDIDPVKLNECYETLYKKVLLAEKEGK